jgi:hypothetical protein
MRRYTTAFAVIAFAVATTMAAPPKSIFVSGEVNGWCIGIHPEQMEVCGDVTGDAAGEMWSFFECYGPYGRDEMWIGEGTLVTNLGTFQTWDFVSLYPTRSRTAMRWEGLHLVYGPEGYIGYLNSHGTADAVLLNVNYTYEGTLTPKSLPKPVALPEIGE